MNDKHTIVTVADEAHKVNNANHKYYIHYKDIHSGRVIGELGVIKFQKGPVNEVGVNGCVNEDLIEVVIHRLKGFQEGKFKCRENAIAITKFEEGLLWLNKRTAERIDRGVEGFNKL